MKILPDTNVLIYDTIEDSMHHEDAVKIIDSASELIIPSIVVYEYIWVMLKKLNLDINFVRLKVLEYLEDPRTSHVLENMNILQYALTMLKEDKRSYKYVNDYVILSVAKYFKAYLATFDKELKIIAQNKGLKVIP